MDIKTVDAALMYFFLYHDDYYAPLQIKSLSGHIHMYKMENKLLPSQVTLQKHCLWDTVTINWDNVQILKHDVPVADACHSDSAINDTQNKNT